MDNDSETMQTMSEHHWSRVEESAANQEPGDEASCCWPLSEMCVSLCACVFIAWSEPQGCRSRCCLRSLWPSSGEPMRLSWPPSAASWPPAAASPSSPASGPWPAEGADGGLLGAFLALGVATASPGCEGQRGWGGGGIQGKKKTCLWLCWELIRSSFSREFSRQLAKSTACSYRNIRKVWYYHVLILLADIGFKNPYWKNNYE